MAYIGKKPEDAFRGLAYYDTFTGDGSTTTFDLSADAPDGGQNDITVVVDNVRQEPGATKSYTLGDDGSGNYRRITFNVAPDNGSEIYAINPGRSTQLNTVSDNAISAAKIQTDAVTTAKIQDSAVTNDKLAGSIANAKLANSSITINGNAVSLGGSVTAGTDWQAVTVADGSTTLNAVAGKGYFLDTNAGVIEVFLPTSPTRGDTVILMDYAGTFATNNVIVNTGTTNLDSTTTRQYTLTTNDTIAEFVYVDSAKGWVTRINTTTGTTPSGAFTDGIYDSDTLYISATGGTITTSGDYKIHTFTGDGCFVVSTTGIGAGPNVVDYLVVAGGGGGGFGPGPNDRGAGAGAGGYREAKTGNNGCHTASPLATPTGVTLSATTYPITVGSGGAGSSCGNSKGTPGSNSIFSTITSAGGGGGGAGGAGQRVGLEGGSGGGGGSGGSGCAGGAGNTPPVSPPQGSPGGFGGGGGISSPNIEAAGGGGAGATGTNATPTAGGTGGDGAGTLINPATGVPGPSCLQYYAGGGGAPGNSADEALGGGGKSCTAGQVSGDANSGGGGAGNFNGGAQPTGSGGKGIVVIRYKFQN